MQIEQAIRVLREAINYIDKSGNCDDKPLDYPNGDEMAIALNTLEEKITSHNKQSSLCLHHHHYHDMGSIICIDCNDVLPL